jgi:hypothetical protein
LFRLGANGLTVSLDAEVDRTAAATLGVVAVSRIWKVTAIKGLPWQKKHARRRELVVRLLLWLNLTVEETRFTRVARARQSPESQ